MGNSSLAVTHLLLDRFSIYAKFHNAIETGLIVYGFTVVPNVLVQGDLNRVSCARFTTYILALSYSSCMSSTIHRYRCFVFQKDIILMHRPKYLVVSANHARSCWLEDVSCSKLICVSCRGFCNKRRMNTPLKYVTAQKAKCLNLHPYCSAGSDETLQQ